MAENSTTLTANDKKNTGKTSKLTADQSLEILQQVLIEANKSGIDAKVSNYYHDGMVSVIVVLANVELTDGRLLAMPDTATGNIAGNVASSSEEQGA